MNAPFRPVLRYLGGKWRLAPWVIRHMPPHEIYVEPFGGAASVLLRKIRSHTEVYNDLDDGVVELFRILRDPASAEQLIRLLELTPFSRSEFLSAYEWSDDPIERARRLVTRSFMGFGSCASRRDRTTGFRTGHRGGESHASREWSTYPPSLRAIVSRLAGVAIENVPASKVIASYDSPKALFYVDPPYPHGTRSPKRTRTAPSNGYTHELDDSDHVALLEQLLGLKGMVVLSGYPNPIYDGMLAHWLRVERAALADGARPRTEVLWINPAAARAMQALQQASAARAGSSHG